MPTLSTSPSGTSESTFDKKLEGGGRAAVAAAAAESTLPALAEEDMDEGAKLAGSEAVYFTEEEQNAVRRKLDFRILPLLAAVYFSQFLDKNSINYSSAAGLPITGEHYNLVSLAFYIGYFIFELPSSSFAQRFNIAKYLGVNMVIWSAALYLHAAGAAGSLWGLFFFFRVMLGAAECCVSPILIALVSAFYAKREQSTRIAAFYAQNGITNRKIVGGAIAYGTLQYSGSLEHWRLIYCVLGSMALVVAVSVLIWLPGSPATASFLTEREKQIALERVRANQSGTISHVFKKEQMREAFRDPKVGLLILTMAMISVPNAAITTFTSILLKSFGYTSEEALLMNMPAGAVAIVTTVSISVLADKKNWRMIPLILCVVPSIVGFAVLLAYSQNGNFGQHKGPLLAGILLCQCFVSGIAMLYSWSAANIAGSTKKSVVNALMLCAFAGGNAAGTQAFQAKDAPTYVPGKAALMALLFCVVCGASAMHLLTSRLNKKKAEEVARLVQENGWTDEDLEREKAKYAFADLTDSQNPFFSYVN
ncbi:hypothetical protein JCM10213_007698 [Rhodosporidiobolus nylandii]